MGAGADSGPTRRFIPTRFSFGRCGGRRAGQHPSFDWRTPRSFGTLGFWGLTAGLVLVGYAAYLAALCIWAKKTLMRELLGPDVFKTVVLTKLSLGQAQEEVLARLMLVVEHNQRDLIERRRRLNQGLAAMDLGVTLIGNALWFNSCRFIG